MRMSGPLILLLVSAAPAAAQVRPSTAGGTTASLGQPEAVQWTAGAAFGWRNDTFGQAAFGVQRDLLSPLLSVLALHGEAYAQADGTGVNGGARARLLSPVARFGVGADYRHDGGWPDVLLSVFHPLRRGGLFHDATVLRVDYIPARSHEVIIGVEKPVFGKPRLGKSRPRYARVTLPTVPPIVPHRSAVPPLAAVVADLRKAVHHVRVITLPLGPISNTRSSTSDVVAAEILPVQSALATAATVSNGSTAAHDGGPALDVVRAYHASLERAFSIAAGSDGSVTPAGRDAAAAARRILLADVLLPYNRLLGQVKRKDNLHGLAALALATFERWVHAESAVAPLGRDAVTQVFAALLVAIEDERAALREQWLDSRFVWLPLQLALLPEQHDTQAEIDAIIEAAIDVRFTDGNYVSYVVNEQFQYHLSRTIRAARDYHVLWTHDFRGTNSAGLPDEAAFRHVLISYLGTLTQRVREYDATGRMPTYMIIIDQWFYEVNRARTWLTLLEDPLHHRVRLPPAYASWEASLAAAQEELRAAVASSALLQAQRAQHGDAWLRNLVKVHVNVTNPADPSFWSTSVIRLLPLPDNMMRDHRKMVFYDVTEADPYRGEAIFTGAGIGEHYANLSWEDRSLMVQGPALLPLRALTRTLLVNQGIPRQRIPAALEPQPKAPDYEDVVRAAIADGGRTLRALQVHNGAGYDDKQVNVVKAILYTLMPPGSVLKIPDSLWNSDFWTSTLLGCALRGGRVIIIAPAENNAPAVVMGTLGRSRELLGRVITAAALLQPQLDAASGLLRVGLYSSELQVVDLRSKIAAVRVAFDSHAWVRDLFNMPESVLQELDIMVQKLDSVSARAGASFIEFDFDAQPKLHIKANFFASREAWTLMSRPEWGQAAWTFLQLRFNQVEHRSAAVHSFQEFPEGLQDVGWGMVEEWHASLDPDARSRVVFYALMGSHNQNSRSMVIDAEVGFLISQWPAVIPHIDLIVLMGQTRWMDTAADLAAWLPPNEGRRWRLAHWVRLAL
jgi:hypothetical protein